MRKCFECLSFTLGIVLFLLLTACGEGEKITLNIAGGATGYELDLTVAGTQRFMEKHPNIRVNVGPIPSTTTGRLALYESLFESGAVDFDVLLIDVVWIGRVAPYAVDLSEHIPTSEIGKHFPSLIQNNTVQGKLAAMPWYADAPSLFYRKDLITKYGYEGPPTTWDELEEMAGRVAAGERAEGNFGFWGYVWQGRPYEGLTCNALEWQASQGGGNILDNEGKPSFLNPSTITAFTRAAGWIGKITPSEVLDYDEDASRQAFLEGNAAFMRNWSYSYALAKKEDRIKGKFDVARMPAGSAGSASTLGGWQLMVSRFSSHPKEAALLVEFLTNEAEQKIRAIEGAYNPTVEALYTDPQILAAVPFFEGFREVYDSLVIRPSVKVGADYAEISQVYWTAVSDILKGAAAEDRLAQAKQEIEERFPAR